VSSSKDFATISPWLNGSGGKAMISRLTVCAVLASAWPELKTPASFPGGDRRARVRAKSGARAARTEGLVQSQEKLCAALSEINQLKQGDMSRLAHAVAHLTQAAVSLERWADELDQRMKEPKHSVPETKGKLEGGLTPETAGALRNALLGIAPFSPEGMPSHNAEVDRNEAGSATSTGNR
jgi:hypothetical protein